MAMQHRCAAPVVPATCARPPNQKTKAWALLPILLQVSSLAVRVARLRVLRRAN